MSINISYRDLKMARLTFLLASLLLSCFLLNAQVDAKEYMRCQLARELLQKYGINKTFLSNCKYHSLQARNTILFQ